MTGQGRRPGRIGTVTAMDDPEQRLSEALRARASQAGAQPPPFAQSSGSFGPPYRPGAPSFPPGPGRGRLTEPAPNPLRQVWWALAIALLAGAVLGCALALLSVLVPGLLPPLG